MPSLTPTQGLCQDDSVRTVPAYNVDRGAVRLAPFGKSESFSIGRPDMRGNGGAHHMDPDVSPSASVSTTWMLLLGLSSL